MIPLLWLTACDRGDPSPVEETGADLELRRTILAGLVDHVVLARIDELQQSAASMTSAVSSLCASPSPSSLGEAQAAWLAARGPLKRLEVLNFGPMTEEPYRIKPKWDLWPGRPDSVESYLAGDGGFEQSDFDNMGGATRGFPALEILLWYGEDPLAAMVADPDRCSYALGLSRDIEALAARAEEAFGVEWRERITSPEVRSDDMYDVPQDVIDEWVNRMAFTVEDIRFVKLGKPLGDSSGGEPLPDTIESRYSGRSLQDARDALQGVYDIFRGAAPGEGLAALLHEEDARVASVNDTWHENARQALEIVLEPLEVAVTADRTGVQTAQDQLQGYQVAIQVELAQALSVTVAFNDNDGD